ncbi:hypothetical protein, partial [Nitrospirillum viridazoti]
HRHVIHASTTQAERQACPSITPWEGGAALTLTIKLMAGREEIHLVYFDKKARPIRGYNVFLYLMHQRRARLISSMEEAMPVQGYTGHMERELRALTRQLTVAGQDILEGSTEWTKTYHWPTLTLDAETAALL